MHFLNSSLIHACVLESAAVCTLAACRHTHSVCVKARESRLYCCCTVSQSVSQSSGTEQQCVPALIYPTLLSPSPGIPIHPHTLRTAAADMVLHHKEFTNAGKAAGLQIWRIENLELVPLPESLHGNFYTGDAYVILYTVKQRDSCFYHLHYWLGKQLKPYTFLIGSVFLFFLTPPSLKIAEMSGNWV